MFIIISGIILLALFLLGVDFLVKYYITNLLSYELKYGRNNSKILEDLIEETINKTYSKKITELLLKNIKGCAKDLEYTFNDIRSRQDSCFDYMKEFDEKIKTNFDNIKRDVKEAMHDTEVRIDTILKMVRKEK